jgi:hypothetical protein
MRNKLCQGLSRLHQPPTCCVARESAGALPGTRCTAPWLVTTLCRTRWWKRRMPSLFTLLWPGMG